MKNYTRHLLAGAMLLLACTGAKAQTYGTYQQPMRVYYGPQQVQIVEKTYTIDWLPEELPARRYTLAVHPFYLTQDGLRLDFEMELARPGRWLQLELKGYYANDYEHGKNESLYYGWDGNIMSSGEYFHGMHGAAAGIGYKIVSSRGGWYTNFTFTFNYFNVKYYGFFYNEYTEDGYTYLRGEEGMRRKEFYKPVLTANVGKHMAITRSIFLDMYIGLGFGYSFYEGESTHFNSNYAFGGRGFTFNGGVRIGWLFGK